MAAIQNSQRSIMNYSDKIELTPPGHWGNFVDNIHIFEDLLLADELAELFRYAKCNDDWSAVRGHHQWSDRVHRDFTESTAKHIYNNLHVKTKNLVETTFNVLVDSAGFQLNRWRVGDKHLTEVRTVVRHMTCRQYFMLMTILKEERYFFQFNHLQQNQPRI